MNNGENKNELNAISLGNVENMNGNLNVPIQDIPPVAPIEPIESLDTLEDTPIINPTNVENNTIPNEVNNMNTVPPVELVAPISYEIPEALNTFNTTPVFNEIGTIPPIPNTSIVEPPLNNNGGKKKGKMNKTIFVLIIILALTAVGVAVYIFLHLANTNKTFVRTKNIDLEIGSEVSTNIIDYATFSNVDSNNCSLDTTAVTDTSILNAEYTYKIICGTTSYTGKIKIVDTKSPEVKLKEVTVAVNGSVLAEDFIESCTDSTKCSYSFKEEDKVKEYLKTPESYRVAIIVKDEAGNEVEVTGTLVVSNSVSSIYLICTKASEATRFGLVDSTFNKKATRAYTFKFATSDAYNQFKTNNSNKTEVTYEEITGTPTYNDKELSLTITKTLTYEELNNEAGSTIPLSAGDLRKFYEDKGYSCSIGF